MDGAGGKVKKASAGRKPGGGPEEEVRDALRPRPGSSLYPSAASGATYQEGTVRAACRLGAPDLPRRRPRVPRRRVLELAGTRRATTRRTASSRATPPRHPQGRGARQAAGRGDHSRTAASSPTSPRCCSPRRPPRRQRRRPSPPRSPPQSPPRSRLLVGGVVLPHMFCSLLLCVSSDACRCIVCHSICGS
ncbi:hypothetical protein HU200_053360 [Digitaria exilis]|uniref:Uncharacterized protein n=1 Tax=Digitaria exilis TaxID=1010633 RepID=A0A835E3C1_9POAL|nr:hypothetical protein HU200_053360 [Digitaria exilis]